MTSGRLERIKEIFHDARQLAPDEREAFLVHSCGTDMAMRQEIDSLLKAGEETNAFVADLPAQLTAEILAGAEITPLIGRTIGRYKLVERLGAGGMGEVYLAERADQQFQMQVAIKLIKRGMDTESVLRRFQHERQILASLDHPNIARLLDGGETDDGLPYFVMEYIKGERIDSYATRNELSIKERLELFRQACSAVSYAHQHLVVHRDLKPSNILVTPEGVVKLLDFGIARIIQADDVSETMATMTAGPIMTPEYASPEQITGTPATTLSDVYSLGAVLYQLLSGHAPHRLQTRSPHEVAEVLTRGEVEKPSSVVSRVEVARQLRGDLDNIVRMAMRKEAPRRYRSIEQFSDDIRRHLTGRPVIARADTWSYRSAKFVRRNALVVSGVGLLLVTLVGGIVATLSQAHRARAEQALAERRFQDVRKLAHSVLFDYHDAIKNLPGSTPVRVQMVRDALEYLDRLASEAQGDQALQGELAAAYERVGDVQGGSLFANIGDTAGAIESYRKSLSLRELLLHGSPGNFERRRDVALSGRKLGLLIWETGNIDTALENTRHSLALFESLAREHPDDLEIHFQVHSSYDYVGMILQEHGEPAEALRHYRKSLEVLESLPPESRDSERTRRSLSVDYEHIGAALMLTGDLEHALEQNRKALAVRSDLSRDFPLNVEHRRTVAVSHYNDGEILAKMGRDSEALESYLKNLGIVEELAKADPQNNQYRDDHGYALIRVGDMLAKLGDFPQALARYRECLEMRTEDVKADPSQLWKRASLIEAHAKMGKVLVKTGEDEMALAAAKKALALMQETSVEPTNAQIRGFFADTYVDLGEVYSALAANPKNHADELRKAACTMYRRSLEILHDLRNRGLLSAGEAAKPETVAQSVQRYCGE